ncbi:MAG TPA: T9SS type A sorting domain-containing protein [Saprospiraceae bacterium]|nr:T9SS type A sorting domain-containing protein [Saprospiraceae bacterium]
MDLHKYMKRSIFVLAGFLSLSLVAWGQSPSNKLATTSALRQYDYLYNYKKSPKNCVLIGQNLGHKNQILDYYDEYIVKLKNETGHIPAIIGGDLGLEGPLDVDLLGDLFKDHIDHGGMVTLSWQCLDPWTGTYYADDQKRDFKRLMDPTDTLHDKWLAELDDIADVLGQFQERDITVLWRPFSDMNGDWFWWGADSLRAPEDFHHLWQFTYDYLTNVKKLNNLLWVFSINQSKILTNRPSFWLRGDTYFPGEEYVDIVGITLFNDNLEIKDFRDFLDLKRFNKPMALTLCGPTPETADGDYDYMQFFDALQQNFPEIVYANVMHSYANVKLALTDNLNYVQLLSQPCVVNQDEIDLTVKWTSDEEHVLDDIEVFPVPAANQFYVSNPTIIDGPIYVKLTDINGHTAFEKSYDHIYFLEIDVTDVPGGFYFLEMTTQSSSFQKKVVFR